MSKIILSKLKNQIIKELNFDNIEICATHLNLSKAMVRHRQDIILADSSKSSKLLVSRGTKWGAAATKAWVFVGVFVGVRHVVWVEVKLSGM